MQIAHLINYMKFDWCGNLLPDWKVCKMCGGDRQNLIENIYKTSKLHGREIARALRTFQSGPVILHQSRVYVLTKTSVNYIFQEYISLGHWMVHEWAFQVSQHM